MFEIATSLEDLSYAQENAIRLLQVLHEFCQEEGIDQAGKQYAMEIFGSRMIDRVALLGCAIRILVEHQEATQKLTEQLYELSHSQKEKAVAANE